MFTTPSAVSDITVIFLKSFKESSPIPPLQSRTRRTPPRKFSQSLRMLFRDDRKCASTTVRYRGGASFRMRFKANSSLPERPSPENRRRRGPAFLIGGGGFRVLPGHVLLLLSWKAGCFLLRGFYLTIARTKQRKSGVILADAPSLKPAENEDFICLWANVDRKRRLISYVNGDRMKTFGTASKLPPRRPLEQGARPFGILQQQRSQSRRSRWSIRTTPRH